MERAPHGLAFVLAVALLPAACEAPEAEPSADAEPAAESAAMEPAAPAVDAAAVEQAIRDREAAWARAAMVSADSFASFYMSDAVVMAPDGPPMQGPAAIAEGMGPLIEIIDSIAFETVAVDVAESGELAVEQGRYTLTATTPDGAAMDDEGSYLVVWKQQDGQWMVARDIFNSDRPAEGGGEM